MARGSSSYTQLIGSLANYKAYIGTIAGVVGSAGVRTADTGQVNWATVATENTTVGRDYEIYALGGPLQATAPIFLRFDYVGGNTGGTNGIHITVGTTTDGAGNLGGLLVSRMQLQLHAIGGVNTMWAWAASDQASYFTFLYALDIAVTGADGVGMVVVERTRDPDGTATGAGFHVWRWYASTAAITASAGGWSKTFGAGSQPTVADYNYNVMVPDLQNNSTAAQSGGLFYAFPAYTYTPPVTARGASKALMFGYAGDFPRGTAVPITHYGESMNFIPLADAVATLQPSMSTAAAATTKPLSPMIRWD